MITTPHRWTYLLIAGLALALAAGCSSDSNPTGGGGGGGGTPPGTVPLQNVTVQPPAAMQTAATANPSGGAAQGVGYFDQYNSIDTLSSWFTPPAPVRGSVPASPAADTTRWTEDSLDVTLVTTEAGGETYTYIEWTVILNGADEFNTYSDFTFIAGSQTTDTGPPGAGGTVSGHIEQDNGAHHADAANTVTGFMVVYDRANPPQIQYDWNWGTDPLGRVTGGYGWGIVANPEDIFIQFNEDGSGYITYSLNYVVRYRADWTAAGTGTWTTYDDEGDQVDTGTW
jgi:hypothetical protein